MRAFTPTLLLAALWAQTSLAHNVTTPGPCTGDCHVRDPSIVQNTEGTYYMFSSQDQIAIRTSKSIKGPWTLVGSIFTNRQMAALPGNTSISAPDVHFGHGTYYCFYSMTKPGSAESSIGYAFSWVLNPGSWLDEGEIRASNASSPYNAVDPNMVAVTNDTDGNLDRIDAKVYMTWGSARKGIYGAYSDLTLNTFLPSGNTKQLAYQSPLKGPIGGSFVFPHGGYYYLIFTVGRSSGFIEKGVPILSSPSHIRVCRSASVSGPYLDKKKRSCLNGGGTVLLAGQGNVFAPGGASILRDRDGGLIFYYHYLNKTIGYKNEDAQFGWNTVRFEKGWPTLY